MNPADAFALAVRILDAVARESAANHRRAMHEQRGMAAALRGHSTPSSASQPPLEFDDDPIDGG